MPLISIIIPVYNNIKYLKASVSSVLRIKNCSLEVILINDGSTDGCGLLCDKIAQYDNRVKVFHQPNSGVSIARNNGIANSQGEYLYFLDSDDICMLSDFEMLSSEDDLYLGWYAVGNEHNHTIVKSDDSNKSFNINYLKGILKCCIGSFIVKRNIIVEGEILFPDGIKYGEDQEFILKVLTESQTVKICKNVYCLYRTNLSSAMYKITLDRFDVVISRIRLMAYSKQKDIELFHYLKNTAIGESIKEVCEGLFRYGMPYKIIRRYLVSNSDIYYFLKMVREDSETIPNSTNEYITNAFSLWLLQQQVLMDKAIYSFRCFASKLRSKLIFKLHKI